MNGIKNERNTISLGYIILPDGVERDEYVSNSFNTEQFVVLTNDSEFITCICTKEVLNNLEIPKETTSTGTQVLISNTKNQNKPIIFATLSKKGTSNFRDESEFDLSKSLNGGEFNFTFNGKGSSLVAQIKNQFNRSSSFLIQCFGNLKSKLSIQSSGWIMIKFSEGFKLKNKDKEFKLVKEKLYYSDEYGNKVTVDDNGIHTKDKHDNKITLGENGITIVDTNENTIILNENGIEVKDFHENNLTLDSNGIIVTDTNENKITLKNSGIEVEDLNENKIILTDNNITVDNGSAKIQLDGSKYMLGNIDFQSYMDSVLNHFYSVYVLNTSLGPTSPGSATSPSGPALQQLITQLNNINN